MFNLLHVTSFVVVTSIFLSTIFSNTSVVTTNLEWIKLGYVYKLTLSLVATRASQRIQSKFLVLDRQHFPPSQPVKHKENRLSRSIFLDHSLFLQPQLVPRTSM